MNILLTTKTKPTLHFLCGKMATGKSTLYNALAVEKNAVLICEDLWLSRLYPTEIASFDNYLMYSARPKDIMKPHLTDLLRQGTCVVLDFPPTCRVSASGSATLPMLRACSMSCISSIPRTPCARRSYESAIMKSRTDRW